MTRTLLFGVPAWSLGAPFAACLMLAVTWGHPAGGLIISLVAAALIAACFAAVHHAEVIAHRVGEPFGTLILALAVTVIEVGLIVSIMLSGGTAVNALARDTVFATVMIVCNGVVGLCLLLGAIRHNVLVFRVEGTSSELSVLTALTSLTLILPSLTVTTPGPTLAPAQLVFAGTISLVLYGIFVFVQTVRHRDYFLPIGLEDGYENQGGHVAPPSTPVALTSFALMCVSLVAVVGLAKSLAPSIEAGVAAAAAPPAVVGIAIALLVLLPETSAAVRAAIANRMQTSLNLALGSALATIGLTIPAVVVVSMLLGLPLELGLAPLERALLLLTLLISTTTLASGRATVLQGAVHLVLFAVFLLFAFVP